MPWTKNDYPDSMKNMKKPVREKAIEIANELVENENMEEGTAIATAQSRAKDWAENRNIDTQNRNTDPQNHGKDQYVIPHDEGWAVKSSKADKPSKVLDNKDDAIAYGRKRAKEHHAQLIIQRNDGTVQDKRSYNPNAPGR